MRYLNLKFCWLSRKGPKKSKDAESAKFQTQISHDLGLDYMDWTAFSKHKSSSLGPDPRPRKKAEQNKTISLSIDPNKHRLLWPKKARIKDLCGEEPNSKMAARMGWDAKLTAKNLLEKWARTLTQIFLQKYPSKIIIFIHPKKPF